MVPSLRLLRSALFAAHADLAAATECAVARNDSCADWMHCAMATYQHIECTAAAALSADVKSAWYACSKVRVEAANTAQQLNGNIAYESVPARRQLRIESKALSEQLHAGMAAAGLTAFLPALREHWQCVRRCDGTAACLPGRLAQASQRPLQSQGGALLDTLWYYNVGMQVFLAADTGSVELVQDVRQRVAAAGKVLGEQLAALRLAVLRQMLARLVDTHLREIKARLWRPEGRLMQRRLQRLRHGLEA